MGMILLILAAALCAGYCILTASIRSGSKFYMIWGLLAVLLAALALMCHLRVWEQLSPGIRRCLVVLVAAGALFFAAVEGCVLSGFWEKGEPQLDYLIVLGAQVKEDGPSVVLRYRLDAACAYLLENEDTGIRNSAITSTCAASFPADRGATSLLARRRGCTGIWSKRESRRSVS